MCNLDIVTKMQVNVPKENVFEAFVNPNKIGGFGFLQVQKDGNKVKPLPYVTKNITQN